jgi:hypothetical protein
VSSSATNAFSVIDLLRFRGLTTSTKAALVTTWTAQTGETIDPARMDDGTIYLVAAGLATTDGPSVTATHVDTDGKPSRVRRKPGDDFNIELLPPGASPQSI